MALPAHPPVLLIVAVRRIARTRRFFARLSLSGAGAVNFPQ